MKRSVLRLAIGAAPVAAVALLAGCGGGIGHSSSPGGSSTPATAQASAATPFSGNCGTAVPTGSGETFTLNSSVQPQIAVVPGGNLVGVWEQDRWSGLGARGIMSAHSGDGGATWSAAQALPFSACGNGSVGGVVYDRTSDPWISFAGGGVVYASALAFSANGYTGGSGFGTTGGLSAVLVSRSADGGATWSAPSAVMTDTNAASPFFFNDKDAVTADPSTGNVYIVWDRLTSNTTTGSAPAWIASSTNGGSTWNTRVLYDPGAGNEAFANQIVILPNGHLLDLFLLISSTISSSSLQVIQSTDGGSTWSTTSPTTVATVTSVGTTNPITNGVIRDASHLPQVAVDPASGNVAAVWQQSFTSGAFDGIALSTSTNGGATWSAFKQINGASGFAAFDPSVRYLPSGVIAVTYYDFRDFVSGSSVLTTSA